MTTPTINWTKQAAKIYTATIRVALVGDYGPYESEVFLRLDARDGRGYRFDMACWSPWEAADGGEDPDRNLRAAKVLAARWLGAVREQGTLTPRGWR